MDGRGDPAPVTAPPDAGVVISEHASKNTHAVAERLLRRCDGVRKVLDIPAGEGAFTRRLVGDYDVTAADVQAVPPIAGSTSARADMVERLPWDDGAFDAVVNIDGIEHIERQFDFVRECRRVLRPGGYLILSTPNISALRSRWRYLLTGFHNKGKAPLDETRPTPWHHVALLSFPQLRYLLHRSGFRITDVTTNRIKAISWVYAPLAPAAWTLTRWVFHREEKDPAQRRRNREIAKQMFSREVLFGEALILRARRLPVAAQGAERRL